MSAFLLEVITWPSDLALYIEENFMYKHQAFMGFLFHFIGKVQFITKTYLYNTDTLKPHFYLVNQGFKGYTLFFLFLLKTDCGSSLELPRRGSSNKSAHKSGSSLELPRRSSSNKSTHNLCFEQKYEKYPNFYLKIFSFWW